jgi:protein-S-isoprenylcysteine O-methyltransferase Ste14
MDTVAYWLALLTLVMVPPFMAVWFVVHPLVRFWRRLGPSRTYTFLGLFVLFTMWPLIMFRHQMMRVSFGVNWVLVIVAVQIFLISMLIGVLRMRHLKPAAMLGLPELRGEGDPGTLLTEGIYSLIRHPRYAEVWLGLLSIALFTNYLAVYILVIVFVPVIYGVVLLEERELRERFGREYEKYCAEVPRFFPKKHRESTGTGRVM